MKRVFICLMAAGLICGFGIAEKTWAVPFSVTWPGPNTVEDETVAISPTFTADSILSMSGAGGFHSHSEDTTVPLVTASVDVIMGAVHNIFPLGSTSSTSSTLLSSLGVFPLTFTPGTVTGLRFFIDLPGQFHSMTGETITFNTPTVPPPPNGVPEPATLLFLGSGLLGLIAFRARFK